MDELRNTEADAFMREVGRRLKAARNREGLSLQAVADRLGLKSRAAVGHWETGKNPIDLGKLWRLARMYRTSVVGLVADDLSPDDFIALTRRQLEKPRLPVPPVAKRLGEPQAPARKRGIR